jgi:ATP-binding cassette, subfamily B, bacterial
MARARDEEADGAVGDAPASTWRGVRVIAGYVRTHPRPFAAAVTGAAIFASMTVASSVVLGRIADDVIVPAFEDDGIETSTALWGALAVVIVAALRGVGVVLRRFFAGITASRMAVTLRLQVVDRYQELPLAYHQSHPTGELVAHAEADIAAATEAMTPLPFSTALVLMVLFAAVALVLTDPILAVVGLALLPTLSVLNVWYQRHIEGPAERAQAQVGVVSSIAHESFDGVLTVKSLGREDEEIARFAEAADRLRDERIAVGQIRAGFEPALDALPALGTIALLALGSWRVSRGELSTGELVQFIALFGLLAFPMRIFGFLLAELPRAVVGRARIQEVLDEPLGLPPAAEVVPLPDGPLAVSVRALRAGYGGQPVLDDLSFELDPGEVVALVGATGSGKSTLCRLLVRLADPDDGSVRLGGVDLRHLARTDLRAAAAIVFQESFLFATSLDDNIALGADVDRDAVRSAARLARADGFVSRLPAGYDTVVGERGVTLSGGQRQRIALARALVRAPRFLILDDATSAVDPTVEAEILAGLSALSGTTTLVVAHRVSTIALADRVLFLEHGRVAASGPHTQLLDVPAYEAMVRAYERGTVG